ncbi:MAG: hypothetical protein LQ338_001235 [Usnochroma carphineum]|nr:MAG: hypothetical protein LQ338_001235 [Usnochroma carphineum]
MSQAVGISFGPEYITVSKAQDDEFVDYINHAASSAYQELFQHVLQRRVQGDLNSRPGEEVPDTHLLPPQSRSDEVENLLRQELEAVTKRIPDAVKAVPAISIPYHWNETVQRAIFKAAEGAKIPLAGIHMLLKLPRALERGYQLDSRTSEDDYYFIIVEYNSAYLHLLICETSKDGGSGIVEGQVQLPHLGEKSASRERYNEEVLEAIKRFMSLTTIDGVSSKTDGRLPYNKIIAVILSGEASSEGMQEIGGLLKQVFGENLLFSSHPPLYTGALGAARVAKQQVEDPKSTKDFVSMPHDIPDEPKPS